jgi:hypothetical protein
MYNIIEQEKIIFWNLQKRKKKNWEWESQQEQKRVQDLRQVEYEWPCNNPSENSSKAKTNKTTGKTMTSLVNIPPTLGSMGGVRC